MFRYNYVHENAYAKNKKTTSKKYFCYLISSSQFSLEFALGVYFPVLLLCN